MEQHVDYGCSAVVAQAVSGRVSSLSLCSCVARVDMYVWTVATRFSPFISTAQQHTTKHVSIGQCGEVRHVTLI